MFAKEDIIDGWWKGGRTPSCRVSGLLEPRSGADAQWPERGTSGGYWARLTASVKLHSYGKKKVGRRAIQGEDYVVQRCWVHRHAHPEYARSASPRRGTAGGEGPQDRVSAY